MKKNLILVLGLIFGIVMISVVSASWFTGKVTLTATPQKISLYSGQTVPLTLNGQEHSIYLSSMNSNQVALVLDGEVLQWLGEGESQTVEGLKIEVVAIKKGGWFTRSRVEVLVSSVSGVRSCDSSVSCSVSEGESVSYGGTIVTINWMDSDEVVLSVDGERVPASGRLTEGKSAILSDGSVIEILDISKLEVSGEIGMVRFKITNGTDSTNLLRATIEIALQDGNVSIPLAWMYGDSGGFGAASYERLAVSTTNELTYYEKKAGSDYHKYFIATKVSQKVSYVLRAKISEDRTNGRNETRIDKLTSIGWVTVCEDMNVGVACVIGNTLSLDVKEIGYTSGGGEYVVLRAGIRGDMSFNQIYSIDGSTVINFS